MAHAPRLACLVALVRTAIATKLGGRDRPRRASRRISPRRPAWSRHRDAHRLGTAYRILRRLGNQFGSSMIGRTCACWLKNAEAAKGSVDLFAATQQTLI